MTRQRRQLQYSKDGYPPGEVGLLAVVALQAKLDGDTEAAAELAALLLDVVTKDPGPHRSGARAIFKV